MQLKKNPSQKRGVSTCMTVPGRMEQSQNRVILGGKISINHNAAPQHIIKIDYA